ncbi:hypothetical protein [Mammaliicoccus sciuri]|uniref:hypothetical protein n=1 Tax=Mammaliicoccus sciuri TaxID=1296 RepID=UPI001FB38632|nr:hypothetical protein [Mammaliicoccus sciuri]MCJ0969734.1 hypothetical protein [Mammaliicoccus sciuri]
MSFYINKLQRVGVILIDEISNDELKDPTKLRLVIKDMKKNLDSLKEELNKVDGYITEDEKGLKWIVHDLIDDVETIDEKLNDMLDAQKDTRKTIKNLFLSGSIGTIITAIVGFVLKQLGIF